MKFNEIPQIHRNARRAKEILSILAKYGLAQWLRDSDPGFLKSRFVSYDGEKLQGLSQEVRIRMALTELGTTFIKLGQMLSTRADLISPELAAELGKLQQDTPADSPEVVRETIMAELGKPPEEIYASFTDTPLASASIGQVHLATLPGGEEVVVKIQHAGIADTIEKDLDILLALGRASEKLNEEIRLYQPSLVLAEFRKNLLRELDYKRERSNLQAFTRNFEKDETVHIPVAYPEFSNFKVLTMEKLEGFSLAKSELLEAEHIDCNELARRGANLYLEMIFRDGFYHADPHPGNLYVMSDNVIGLIDCGMVGRLDTKPRELFESLLESFVQKDVEQLTDTCTKLGIVPKDLDREALQSEIEEFMSENLSNSLEDLDMSSLFNDLTSIIRKHRIVTKPSISLLMKVLIMLEGTARLLNPSFSLSELAEPYFHKIAERKYGPERLFRQLQRNIKDWEILIKSLPRDLSSMLERIRRGTFDVNLEHRKLDVV
ncbi:MAG: AarF/ABC1/UbiB kinase family protein, partial [Verrucomicrobia bacterium]|nr:AarF/ABC1/UbiB kinase family protein [Verrucomicrobiota bacterium]